MFPNLKFIRMFHIGRDSLVDSALTNNIFSKRKHACMVKFNLSKFYDYAAMISLRANFFSTKFSLR